MEQDQGLPPVGLIQFAAAKLNVKVEERDVLALDDNGQLNNSKVWFELGVYMEDRPFELTDFDRFCRGMRAFSRVSGLNFAMVWNADSAPLVAVLSGGRRTESRLENIKDLPKAFWQTWFDHDVCSGKIVPEKMP